MPGSDPRDCERVPSATEDGLQDGRPHPALRRYIAHYEAVDLATAAERLRMRRAGQMPKIEGGVDDGRAEMELKEASLPNPFEKMDIDPKLEVGDEGVHAVVREAKAPPGAERAPETPAPSLDEMKRRVMSSAPGSVEASVPSHDARNGHYDPFTGSVEAFGAPSAPSPHVAPEVPELVWLRGELVAARKELEESRGRAAALQVRLEAAEKAAREAPQTPEEPFGAWLKGRKRVSIDMGGMRFSIPAVDLVESAYGVALVLPLSPDSVTFTPRPMSDVVLECDSPASVYDTKYTGVSFELPGAGIMVLTFLKSPDSAARAKARAGSMTDLVGSLVSAGAGTEPA